MKTFSAKPQEVTRQWHEIDASGVPIGRLASSIAQLLSGKRKVTYTPHVDSGDYVIVTNAEKAALTGRKADDPVYRYSGYPGGIKSTSRGEVLKQNPQKAIEAAVYGMLPKNKLRPGMLQRLKVYRGADHEHQAQKPKKVEVKS